MNRETLDFLSAEESTLISDDLADLMDDTTVSVAATYKDFVSRTFSPSAGTTTATYTDTALRGVRTTLGARELAAGNGLYQVGDVAFLLAQSDLAVTPHREDRMVVGALTYEVLTWQQDALGKTWRVVAREVVSA